MDTTQVQEDKFLRILSDDFRLNGRLQAMKIFLAGAAVVACLGEKRLSCFKERRKCCRITHETAVAFVMPRRP